MTSRNHLDQTVQQLIDAGSPVGDAIRIALWRRAARLGLTRGTNSYSAISEFAARHDGLRNQRPNVSATIYGKRPATEEILAALVEELGGTPDEMRELLWQAAKPLTATA